MKEIKGDLIKLALEGNFDVIAHGCNCFCTMGAGIAPKMAKTFGCDEFKYERSIYKGDINKLGCIDYEEGEIKDPQGLYFSLFVINAYTQYYYGKNSPGCERPLDYSALELCMRKINHTFAGKHIGLPKIGCGLAGGQWKIVKGIIEKEFSDCEITVVIYE
jgi:O-acetyl-ADP-ribose deacetylase (regulator of RNase III)